MVTVMIPHAVGQHMDGLQSMLDILTLHNHTLGKLYMNKVHVDITYVEQVTPSAP